MTTEITARDKLLLYVGRYVSFHLLLCAIYAHPGPGSQRRGRSKSGPSRPAGADRCAGDHRLAGTNAAAKTESWAALRQANANYYGLLSSSDLDTLVSNLELGA